MHFVRSSTILWTLTLLARSAWAASGPPVVNSGGVLNSASYNLASAAVAPGSIATIFGSNLSNGTSCYAPCGPTFDKNGVLIPALAGVSVTFNGIATPVLVVVDSQVSVQVPVEMAGSSSASVVVSVNGQSSAPVSVPIQPIAPGIFTANASGSGQGAIVNNRDAASGIVSLTAPWFSLPSAHTAQSGDVLQIYGTGFGSLNPLLATGTLPKGSAQTANTTTVSIGGVAASVTYAGASGCCVGLNQINVVMPSGVPSNPATPVVVTVGNQRSNTVTIATGGYMGGLGGTLDSITGAINNSSVAWLGLTLPPPTGSATGSISFTGNGSTSKGQTVFALTGSGSGTISSCALTGSNTASGAWTASSAFTLTVSPAVPSSVGSFIGSYSATTSFTVCGTTLPSSTVYGGVLGGVSASGAISLTPIITSVPGFRPVFAPFSGTVDAGVSGLFVAGSDLFGDPAATGAITIAGSLQSTSDTQTIYAVTGAGSGTASCAPVSGRGNWSASVTSTITLSPPPASLAASGGSVSGTYGDFNGPATLCGRSLNPIHDGAGTVIGTVFPGGGMSLWISPPVSN